MRPADNNNRNIRLSSDNNRQNKRTSAADWESRTRPKLALQREHFGHRFAQAANRLLAVASSSSRRRALRVAGKRARYFFLFATWRSHRDRKRLAPLKKEPPMPPSRTANGRFQRRR